MMVVLTPNERRVCSWGDKMLFSIYNLCIKGKRVFSTLEGMMLYAIYHCMVNAQ